MGNNLKIQFSGTVIKRWKKTLTSGKERIFLAVTDNAVTFPKSFQFTARDMEQVKPFAVGQAVTVTAWVDGREWKKSDTESVFFTDLKIAEITAVPASEPVSSTEATSDEIADDMPF